MIEVFRLALVYNLQGVGRTRLLVRKDREDLRLEKIAMDEFTGQNSSLKDYINSGDQFIDAAYNCGRPFIDFMNEERNPKP